MVETGVGNPSVLYLQEALEAKVLLQAVGPHQPKVVGQPEAGELLHGPGSSFESLGTSLMMFYVI